VVQIVVVACSDIAQFGLASHAIHLTCVLHGGRTARGLPEGPDIDASAQELVETMAEEDNMKDEEEVENPQSSSSIPSPAAWQVRFHGSCFLLLSLLSLF
jgi:hypothetical protein